MEKKIGNALWKKSLGIGTAVVLGLTACSVDNSSDKENVDKTSGNTQGKQSLKRIMIQKNKAVRSSPMEKKIKQKRYMQRQMRTEQ